MINLIHAAAIVSTFAGLATAQPAATAPQPTPPTTPAVAATEQDALLIEIRVYQFKQRADANATVPAKAAPKTPAAAPKPAVGQKTNPGEPEMTHLEPMVPMLADLPPLRSLQIVKPDALVMLAGQPLRLTAPELTTKTIAAPKVLCLPGQPARVIMGRTVTYMEPAGNGLFREVKNEDLFEGLSVKIMGDFSAQDPEAVDVKELSVRLSECVDRAPVEGSDLKVGQPTIHSTSLNVAFSLKTGMCAVLPLPRDNEDAPSFVVVVKIDRRPVPK